MKISNFVKSAEEYFSPRLFDYLFTQSYLKPACLSAGIYLRRQYKI